MLGYGAGDTEAFDALYQRHKTPLYRFVIRQCGQENADELFQDIWLKVINTRNTYQVKAKFKTWLYHLARNRIIDFYRRNSIRPVNSDDEINNIEDKNTTAPEKNLQQRDQRQAMLDAIDELPRDQKESFLLREEAGLNIEQIADTCGINPETAKSRLRYAVNKLRQILANTGDP